MKQSHSYVASGHYTVMNEPRFPSLLHAFLTILFGPFAGIVLRWHYNKQDERKTGSWFWYLSWLAVVAGLSSGLLFLW